MYTHVCIYIYICSTVVQFIGAAASCVSHSDSVAYSDVPHHDMIRYGAVFIYYIMCVYIYIYTYV